MTSLCREWQLPSLLSASVRLSPPAPLAGSMAVVFVPIINESKTCVSFQMRCCNVCTPTGNGCSAC